MFHANNVPDRYVDFAYAQDTASNIKNLEQYITNQLFHNAIQVEAKDVMQRLFRLSNRERDWRLCVRFGR